MKAIWKNVQSFGKKPPLCSWMSFQVDRGSWQIFKLCSIYVMFAYHYVVVFKWVHCFCIVVHDHSSQRVHISAGAVTWLRTTVFIKMLSGSAIWPHLEKKQLCRPMRECVCVCDTPTVNLGFYSTPPKRNDEKFAKRSHFKAGTWLEDLPISTIHLEWHSTAREWLFLETDQIVLPNFTNKRRLLFLDNLATGIEWSTTTHTRTKVSVVIIRTSHLFQLLLSRCQLQVTAVSKKRFNGSLLLQSAFKTDVDCYLSHDNTMWKTWW